MGPNSATEPAPNIELSINERQALKSAAARLQREFPGALDTEAIERLVYSGRRYEEWALDDPAGKGLADVRPIRDEVERRVRLLLNDLRIPYRP